MNSPCGGRREEDKAARSAEDRVDEEHGEREVVAGGLVLFAASFSMRLLRGEEAQGQQSL